MSTKLDDPKKLAELKKQLEALAGHELTAGMVDALVERILVSRDKSFEIVFRFRDEFREVKCVG